MFFLVELPAFAEAFSEFPSIPGMRATLLVTVLFASLCYRPLLQCELYGARTVILLRCCTALCTRRSLLRRQKSQLFADNIRTGFNLGRGNNFLCPSKRSPSCSSLRHLFCPHDRITILSSMAVELGSIQVIL